MEHLQGFDIVLLFIIGGITFPLIVLSVGRLLRPRRPNPEKLSTYESGEEPFGSAWGNFNVRFYVIALIFLVFEIELVFLFPWAIVFGDADKIRMTDGLWGKFALIETFIFIVILLLGLVYVWANGMLDWAKPRPNVTSFKSVVPKERYMEINKKYS